MDVKVEIEVEVEVEIEVEMKIEVEVKVDVGVQVEVEVKVEIEVKADVEVEVNLYLTETAVPNTDHLWTRRAPKDRCEHTFQASLDRRPLWFLLVWFPPDPR